LVWETLILSMARQLGKSWFLRELLLWRIHQGGRFGEPQDVLHTGKDLAICKEVQRPALHWAKARPDTYLVREANGEQKIELKEDRSRWMIASRDGVYGFSVSLGAVDEAWKVKPKTVDEGLAPTMVERTQPQLLLVSTAHREATSLMLSRRQVALENLELGDGDLLIEWSAPRESALDDVDGWRMASPHWSPQRERLVAKQLEAARAGEADPTEDEDDPVEAFSAQWLNRWPRRLASEGQAEPLLEPGLWAYLEEPGLVSSSPLYVAIEDNYGRGAAVAAACRLDDGRVELDGWLCDDWDTAILELQRLGVYRQVKQLLVGASLLTSVPPGTIPSPTPAGSAETRVGLPLFRELARGGLLAHDHTPDLDEAVAQAQVKDLTAGMSLEKGGQAHLIRATVWALNAAHCPAPSPVIF
jgi:hypothetical protein